MRRTAAPWQVNPSNRTTRPSNFNTFSSFTVAIRNIIPRDRDEFSMASVKHQFEMDGIQRQHCLRSGEQGPLHYVFAFGPAGANGRRSQDVSLYSYL